MAEYVEVESGKRNSRPQLQAAISHAKATGAKLVIARLDRLARNLHFVSGLQERALTSWPQTCPTRTGLRSISLPL